MSRTIRWGFIGTGSIAKQFAIGLREMPDAIMVAVGSRKKESAEQFARQFAIPKAHDSYEGLVNNPEVDMVYVSSPHPWHAEHAILAMNAGKGVVCEKPLTVNASQAREMVRVARERKVFLMEAMWSRCFPLMQKVRELIRDGAIGEPRMLLADFGFRAPMDPNNRLFHLDYAGGALLDVGVYTVSLSSMIFGKPDRVSGLAHLGETGVDEQAGMVLGHPKGGLAVLSTAIRINTPHEAMFLGSEGSIKIPNKWWRPTAFSLNLGGGKTAGFEYPLEGNGYQHEARVAMECFRKGLLESDLLPLDESVSIMETMDALRAQWGLKYPMES